MRRFPLPAVLAVCAGLLAGPLLAGALAGRVTDAEGRAVEGARVVAYAFQSPERGLLERTRGSDQTPLSETKTDSNGRFVVSMAQPGADISVRILPADLPAVDLEGPFDLTGEIEDLEVLLPVSEPISGRVLDEAGKPLSGVQVRAGIDPAAAEGDGAAFDETKTSADGTFTLKNAPAGATSLRASLPAFVPSSAFPTRSKIPQRIVLNRGGAIEGTLLDPAGKPAAGAVVVCGIAAAETDETGRYRISAAAEGLASLQALWKEDLVGRRDGVRVKKGETVHADLTLSRSSSIAGTVVDEKTRRPVAGVSVAAVESRSPLGPGGPLRSAVTDGRGKYRIAGLLARGYMVIASRKDYVRSPIPGVLAGTSPAGSAAFALCRTATISGRVSDEERQPVAGARVTVLPPIGRRALLGTRWTRARPATATLPDGTFRLRGVPPDSAVSISAAKPGYVAARRDGIPAAADGAKEIALVLRRGFQARGSAVDERGEPLSAVEIRLNRSERYEGGGFSATSESGGDRPAATTDRDGRFVASALAAGEYTVRFFREGFAKKRLTLEVKSEGVTEWPPVVLRGSAPIAGVVRNAKGDPIAGAQVFSYESYGGGSNQSVSDFDGRFRHDGYSGGSSVTLRVSAPGYAYKEKLVKAPAPDVAVVLSAAGTIRGRVEDAETKRPIENFRVGWGPPRPITIRSFSERDFQSPDGVFEVADVAPGKLEVRASAPGYLEEQSAAMEIGDGETKEGIVISLKKGRSVTGRVLDPLRGAGVANATVSWRNEGSGDARGIMYTQGGVFGNLPNASATDADGGFRYEGVPSGKLVFSASHPDYLEATKTLDTAAGSSVDLVLSIGGSIAGQVVGRDGRSPLPGAVVSLQEQGVSPSVWTGDDARTDSSGRFEFSHLKEGRYRLSARDASGRAPPRDVVLGPDQRVADAVLELAGGTLVRGRVGGVAPEGLSSVRISGNSSGYQTSAPVGEDGQFVLRDVPPGVLRVGAWTPSPSMRSTSKTVEVPEGAAEVPVEVVFEGGSRLTGRVLRGEKGIPGLFVSATPEPAAPGSVRVSARTDENGWYALEGLTDGAKRLAVSGENVSLSRVVTVSGDSSADFVLRGVSLSGLVTDAASGEPIRYAEVRAQAGKGPSNSRHGVSDSQGRYSIEDVEADSYQVTAQHQGYQQKMQAVSVNDSAVELDIALVRGTGLSIRGTDGLTGFPLRSLNVTALSSSGGLAFGGSVSLDASGQGEVSSLAPGRYALYISSTGYAPRVLRGVDVPSPTLALALTPGGTVEIRTAVPLSGHILDAAGAPYAPNPWRLDGSVNLAPPVVAWEHFPPGSYQLVVNGPGAERSFSFAVAEGRTTTLDLK